MMELIYCDNGVNYNNNNDNNNNNDSDDDSDDNTIAHARIPRRVGWISQTES